MHVSLAGEHVFHKILQLREAYTAGYAFATGLCVADFEERQLQINRAQSRRAGDDVSFQVLVQALDRKLGLVGCFDS